MSLIKIVVITLVLREIMGVYGVLVMLYYFTCSSWNSFWGVLKYCGNFRTRRIQVGKQKCIKDKKDKEDIEKEWIQL